jgi:WD40 repeat protein
MGELEIEITTTMKKLLLLFTILLLNQLTFAQQDESIKTFLGHSVYVSSVVFSPDGKTVLSGSDDATIKLWDIATGQCLKTFTGHKKWLHSVAFSPDGLTALSGSSDKTLKLWDIATGKCIKTFTGPGHTAYVTSVAFSPDGKTVLSGSGDNTLKLWDIATGQCIEIFSGHSSDVTSVAFSPDGKTVLSGSGDKTLKLWDIATGQCIETLSGHSYYVNSVAYSPDGIKALSGSYDNTLKLWDIAAGQCLNTLFGHSNEIKSVAFNPHGKTCVSASADKTLKLWDISKYVTPTEIVKPVIDNKPPILAINSSSIKFTDANGNNAVDAFEDCKLTFEVSNTGTGNGYKLQKRVTLTGTTSGISTGDNFVFTLNAGEKKTIEIPVKANANTETGAVTFTFKIDEANGFGTDEYTIEVPTRKFISPLVEVADYTVTGSNGNNLKKKSPFDLQVLVQNTQQGLAEDVKVQLQIPANVLCLSGNEVQSFTILKPGETKSIVYSLIVSDLYQAQTIPISIKLSEKMGKYAQNKSITLNLDQALASGKITINAKPDEQADISITKGSLNVDVDVNIPTEATAAPHKYALIIGNEDYSSFQTGLSTEVNVDFAVNDAQVFKKYCVQTLGVPDNQVRLIKNGTTSQIKQGLEWINKLAKLENGDAEVIFYYSGHGLPDDATKIAYLMPVDISGANVQEGIKLDDVYSKLTEHPTKRTIVLLDACFSGGARNQGLVAMKGSKLKPRDNSLSGNIVVLSSSTGEESSGVYRTNKHGYFTYFLLKKLQETKGDVTLGDLLNDVKQKVQKQSTLESRPQTPGVNYSPAVNPVWENWKLK